MNETLLRELEDKMTQLFMAMQEENHQRDAIKESEAYQELEKKVQAIRQEQDAMLADVPDSWIEYAEVKNQMFELFKENKLDFYGAVTAKWKESKEVSNASVLGLLGGDIDNFLEVATITQAKIKEMQKDERYSDIKSDLPKCIRTTGKELVDVVITFKNV